MTAAAEELGAWNENGRTPGVWYAWDRGVGWLIALDPDGNDPLPEALRTDLARSEDAQAIVAAVNGYGPALERLVAAEAENARLRAQVAAVNELAETFAADADDYVADCGDQLRAALAGDLG